MIPHADNALRMLSQRLMTQLLPDLKSAYSMSDGALIGLLINALADELAEGIERRLEDIDEMRVILRKAGANLTPEEVGTLDDELSSHTLGDVNARHDALTRVLISLHERCEQDDALHDVEDEIWSYLHRTAKRHEITGVL